MNHLVWCTNKRVCLVLVLAFLVFLAAQHGVYSQEQPISESPETVQPDETGTTPMPETGSELAQPQATSGGTAMKDYWPIYTDKTYINLQQKLSEVILDVEIQEESLVDIIHFMKEQTGLNFHIQRQALADAGIDVDLPFLSFTGSQISVLQLLDLLLSPQGLAYYLHDGVVEITTREEVSQNLLVVAYPLAPFSEADVTAHGREDAELLKEMIQKTIEPRLWSDNEGESSISYWPRKHCLVINTDLITHEKIRQLFQLLLETPQP